jgi:hypothetical protein
MTRPSDDFRRNPRQATLIEGSLAGRTTEPVSIIDLSRSGCLVRCTAHHEPGSILDLRMTLAGAPFEAKVQVAQSSLDGAWPEGERRYLAGLSFLALRANDEARLLRFLEALRRRECAPSR